MSKGDNIDKLFRESFNGWEADFTPSEMKADWEKVQQGLTGPSQAPQGGGNSGGGFFSSLKGMIIAGTGTVAIIGTVAYFVALENDKNTIANNPSGEITVVKDIPEARVPEANSLVEPQNSPGDEKSIAVIEETKNNKSPERNTGNDQLARKSIGKTNDPVDRTGNSSQQQSGIGLNQSKNSGSPKNEITTENRPVSETVTYSRPQVMYLFEEKDPRYNSHLVISDRMVCEGENVDIQYEGKDASEVKIQVDGKTLSGNNGFWQVEFDGGGDRMLSIYNKDNRLIDEKLIKVNKKPEAGFRLISSTDQTVKLRTTLSGSYQNIWKLGDGTQLMGEEISHLYHIPGTYEVMLISMLDEDCADTFRKQVVVEPLPQIKVANVVTPNNDGLNDMWDVEIPFEVEKYEVYVFDRDREFLFKSTDINEKWNGKIMNSGPEVKEGTYFYFIKYIVKGEEEWETEKGTIQIRKN